MNLFDMTIQAPPPGLVYQQNFLTTADERELIEWIDAQPWETELKRRRQFYGRSYLSEDEHREMPPILVDVAERLFEQGLVTAVSAQCLINEYLPGQGIAAHTDYNSGLTSQVVKISLMDTYPMLFANPTTGETYEHWLARRSVAIMSGPSRYEWTHEIVKRKADFIEGGGRRVRGRRVSVTLRTKGTPIEVSA